MVIGIKMKPITIFTPFNKREIAMFFFALSVRSCPFVKKSSAFNLIEVNIKYISFLISRWKFIFVMCDIAQSKVNENDKTYLNNRAKNMKLDYVAILLRLL